MNRAQRHTTRAAPALLEVRDLTVSAEVRDGRRTLVSGLSFDVRPGEVVALVGESGSGKSTVCLAITRLLGSGVAVERGSIRFDGAQLLELSERDMRRFRGAEIGMVFQDPLASLNPVRKIGFQLGEPKRIHRMGAAKAVRRWVIDTLGDLGFPEPRAAADAYPPTFSGGMRQRTCVGVAFAAEPRLVIADEPTTSLDVSLQGRLLRLLLGYRERHGTSMILVSHDVDVVKAVADRVVVLYGGRALEAGPVREVVSRPKSPYTLSLLRAIPQMDPGARGRPLPTIEGTAEGAADSAGCPFAPRCARALDVCSSRFPDGAAVGADHHVWCWNPPPTDGEPWVPEPSPTAEVRA
jgi:oligopeptide/dipeptide ABC transporter ATP-binding protein